MTIPYGPILIVEDIGNIRELLEVTLKFKGYPVISARNGEQALKTISEERPALIITDILMPKLDGYDLAFEIRTNPKTQSIPIIFISATYVSPEDKEFAISLGAVNFLEKPVDTEELLLTVAETLTMGYGTRPAPLSEEQFRRGHRKRLEEKLSHKIRQIKRAERLLETVEENQRASMQVLLDQALNQRDEIERKLKALSVSHEIKA